VTSVLGNGVSLSSVFGHGFVDLLNDIEPDGRGEDSWERQ